MNATVPQSLIDQALADDPARASAEWLAKFRTRRRGYISLDVVQAGVGEHVEMGAINAALVSCGLSIRAAALRTASRWPSRTLKLIASSSMRCTSCVPPLRLTLWSKTLRRAERLQDRRRSPATGMPASFRANCFASAASPTSAPSKPKSDLFRDLLPLLNSGQDPAAEK